MVKVVAAQPDLPAPVPSTFTRLVPFRSGLTDKQKDSIIHLLDTQTKEGQPLNEVAEKHPFINKIFEHPIMSGVATAGIKRLDRAALDN